MDNRDISSGIVREKRVLGIMAIYPASLSAFTYFISTLRPFGVQIALLRYVDMF